MIQVVLVLATAARRFFTGSVESGSSQASRCCDRNHNMEMASSLVNIAPPPAVEMG